MTEASVARQQGVQGEYVACIYPGSNTSGLTVYGTHVLVRVDEYAPITLGGVHMIDEVIERRNMASETGCIYAMGGAAFCHFTNGQRWSGDRPELGDRIYFERHAGMLAKGKDGHVYRIMEYTCIAAGLDPTEGGNVIVGENTAIYGKGEGPGFS